MELLPVLRQRFFDDNGDPLVNGKLYSYLAGTATPVATYIDKDGDTPNTNPIILDANGECDVYIGSGSYKFVLTDEDDVIQWTKDDITSAVQAEIASPWATHTVTDGQAAANLTGQTVDFATYSSAIYDVEVIRGTTVFASGMLAVQNVNGTGRVVTGLFLANEDHGITFSVSQAALVCQLKAALDVGAGNGTIKLSRRLVPV